jgi:Lon protease-like protein
VTEEYFIFPLATVLYPGGTLPLRIFEQRYLEMTKICIRDERPFGVCLIREGAEVGEPAVPENVGCLARIEQWDMPQLGLFQLIARGGERFRLKDKRIAPNGLMSASIERIAPDSPAAHIDAACSKVLKLIIERMGASSFPSPLELDDASWVGYRLAEVLPLDMRVKQELLEMQDAGERLDRLHRILVEEGLIVRDPGQ